MLKTTVLTASAAIALAVGSALPASAAPCEPGFELGPFGICEPISREIPEPSTILGGAIVGGALLAKKILAARKARSSTT